MEDKIVERYIKEISNKIEEEIYESKKLITSVIELIYDVEDIFLNELIFKKNKEESEKDKVIMQYFLDFSKRSKEFLVSILLCSRISTAVILRNVVENYVLLYYIFISEQKIAMRYLLWDSLKINFFENERLEKVKIELETNIEKNLKKQKVTEEKISKLKQQIYRNGYGWCYELIPYKKRLNFKNICRSLQLDEIYKDFEYLSSTVHSNEMVQKMFNNVYFYDHVLMYIKMYLDYVRLYLEIYLEIYDEDNDKLKKLEKQISIVQEEQKRVLKEMRG